MFYLTIPFLNILIKNIDEKKHQMLLTLCFFIYVILGTVPKLTVKFNYVISNSTSIDDIKHEYNFDLSNGKLIK